MIIKSIMIATASAVLATLAVGCSPSSQQAGDTGKAPAQGQPAAKSADAKGPGGQTLGTAQNGQQTHETGDGKTTTVAAGPSGNGAATFNAGTTPAATTTTPATTTTTPAATTTVTPVVANNTIASKYGTSYTNPDGANLTDSSIFSFANGTSAGISGISDSNGNSASFSPLVPPGKNGQVGKYDGFDDGNAASFVISLDDGSKCARDPNDQASDVNSYMAQGWGVSVSKINGVCTWKAARGGGGGGGGKNGGTRGLTDVGNVLDPTNPVPGTQR